MAASRDPSRQPLLEQTRYTGDSNVKATIRAGHDPHRGSEEPPDLNVSLDRSVENDVVPETAILGRNLGWSSAYILIISRVIGSGIFAAYAD